MRIKCECGKKYEIPERHIGRKFDCVKCGARIRTGEDSSTATQRKRESQRPAPAPPALVDSWHQPQEPDDPVAAASSRQPLPWRLPEPGSPNRRPRWPLIALAVGAVAAIGFSVAFSMSGRRGGGEVGDREVNGGVSLSTDRRAATPESAGGDRPVGVAARNPDSNQRNDPRYVTDRRPVLPLIHTIDPTKFPFTPAFHDAYGPQIPVLYAGENFGGTRFLQQYDNGMNSNDVQEAIDSAISAANWGHNVKRAIQTIVEKIHNPGLSADGRKFRIEYAYRILNAYPEKTMEVFRDQLNNADVVTYPEIVKLIKEYDLYLPELIQAAQSGARDPVAGWRVRNDFDLLRGYSADRPRRSKVWRDNAAGDVPFAERYGLDLLPPMMNAVEFIDLEFANRLMKDPLSAGQVLRAKGFDKTGRFLAGFGLPAEKISSITTGYVDSFPGSRSLPAVAIVKWTEPISDDFLAQYENDPGRVGVRKVAGGNVLARLSADTMLIGTANEVLWTMKNIPPGYVHPGARQWPEIEGCWSFHLDTLKGRFMSLADDGRLVQRTEVRMTAVSGVDEQAKWKQDVDSRAEQQRSYREELIEQQERIARAPNTDDDTRTASRRMIELLREPGQDRIVATPADDRWSESSFIHVGLGSLFIPFGSLEFSADHFFSSPGGLREQDNETLAYRLRNLSVGSRGQAVFKFTKILDDVILELKSGVAPVGDAMAFEILDGIFRKNEWLAVENIPQLVDIADQIQFEGGEIARRRWLIACLVPIRDVDSVELIHELVIGDDTADVLNLDRVESERKVLQENDNRASRELLKTYPILIDRLRVAIDRLGRHVDYYLQFGQPETQKRCLELIGKIPRLQDGIRFRLAVSLLDEQTGIKDPQLLDKAASLLQAPETIRFPVPETQVATNDISDIVNWLLADEAPVSGPPAKMNGLEDFKNPTGSFTMKIPAVAAEDLSFKFSGNLRNDLPRGQVDRAAPAEDFQWIDGMVMKVDNGDALIVEGYVFTIEELTAFWESGNAVLGANLIRERRGDSNAPFDRIRYFQVNGVPKAERIIAWNTDRDFYTRWGVRWIGRNHNEHPAYVDEILDSFVVPR